RETFLNPLLEELGCDPRNRRGVKNTERDVILEDSVMVDGMMKAPDYAFVIEGRRRFFVEAKRPSINVKSGKSSAHQIRRYCWSAGIPFGVLTNFKEFAVYDCRAIPSQTDSAATSRVAYFTYKDLVAKWTLLYTMFGKHAVRSGKLEQVAAESKVPKNSTPIDDAFLDKIRSSRSSLATDVSPRIPHLNLVELNTSVQTFIDRA